MAFWYAPDCLVGNMENFKISKNRSDIDLDILYDYLSLQSYWGKGRSRQTIEKSVQNSVCYCGLLDGRFIGFARIISDHATFAYLADFFILPRFQKRKFGSTMLESILEDTDKEGLRVYLLTEDGHEFYNKFGFAQDDVLLHRIMRKNI